jgi:hypothetical protein
MIGRSLPEKIASGNGVNIIEESGYYKDAWLPPEVHARVLRR